jgi:putative spermidine/putrescine transport system ATP-binding protein
VSGVADGPSLEVAGLVKSFPNGVAAVNGVSFSVDHGEIVSVLGPSGCGKTTTLRIIAGLERPDVGDVRVGGRSVVAVPAHRRNIGLVFQDLALFPHKTVRENVAFGLRMKGIGGAEADRRVNAAMDLVELPLARFAGRMPSELSGGQRQRVAVARTVAVEPSVVLFDEPMAALDRRLRDRMAIELRRIQKQLNIAAVYVTHDQETASMMSDRIAVMDRGAVVQIAPPLEVYRRPATRFVADFLGDMNFIPATVAVRQADAVWLQIEGTCFEFAGETAATDAVTLAVRPEHIRLDRERPPAPLAQGRLRSSHFVNGNFVHRLQLPSGFEVVARSHQIAGVAGEFLWLAAEPADVRLLTE